MGEQIISRYSFLIIPSWTELIEPQDLGTYLNQKVSKIHTDCVIFLIGIEYSFRTEKGNFHYFFGLGYYSLNFNLESGGKPITDHRTLTGLILSDEIYNDMISSNKASLGGESDIVITDKFIKFPVDLSDKGDLESIKSNLLSKAFLPFKDTILVFLQGIQNPNTYKLKDQGHKLLSTHSDRYNQIIVSKKMELYPFENYMKATAGVNSINYGADQHLEQVLSLENLQDIIDMTIEMNRFYSSVTFNPSYVFSIIENVSAILQTEKMKAQQNRLAQERLEMERREKERIERERLEKERIEKERIEKEKLRQENESLRQEHLKMEEFRKEQEKIHLEREKIRKEKDILEQQEFKQEQAEIQDEFLEDEILKKSDLEARKVSLNTKWKKEAKRKVKQEKQFKNMITFKEKSQTLLFKDKNLGSYKFSKQSWNIFLTLLGMPFEEDEFNKTLDIEEKSNAKLIKKHITQGLVEVIITKAHKKKLRGDKHQNIYWRLSEKGEEIVLLILDWSKKYQK